MIDVTDKVNIRVQTRREGFAVRDELWVGEDLIGYIEPAGNRIIHPHYTVRIGTNAIGRTDERIFKLEANELL